MRRHVNPPVLSVRLTKDGLWSVNERGETRIAIEYFPSKWGAMKHAVRTARTKLRCRVALVETGGSVRASREYRHAQSTEKP
jgi:hypothetical protein